MCKINWEERFFEVAKDLFVEHNNIEIAFLKAQKFIDSYREAYEQANEEITEEEKPKAKKDEGFESAWLLYRRKGSKKKALEQWERLSEDEREIVKGHIPAYIDSVSDIKYQKDFERYLRDKCFNDVVYKNGRVVFDITEEKESRDRDTTKLVIGGVVYR